MACESATAIDEVLEEAKPCLTSTVVIVAAIITMSTVIISAAPRLLGIAGR